MGKQKAAKNTAPKLNKVKGIKHLVKNKAKPVTGNLRNVSIILH